MTPWLRYDKCRTPTTGPADRRSAGPVPVIPPYPDMPLPSLTLPHASGAAGYLLRSTFLSIFPTLVFGISFTTT